MRRLPCFFSVAAAAVLLAACGSSAPAVVSQAYGHGGSDRSDTTNLVAVYPKAAGTRLDSCQTCHKAADLTITDNTKTPATVTHNTKSVCDYCHLVQQPDLKEGTTTPTVYDQPQPTTYEQTLNAYGLAYKNAGRTQKALRDIATADSDGDGYSNAAEIADARYPGDAASNPGLLAAPTKIVTVAQIKAMPVYSEFLLSNSNKQYRDNYATYTGVKITDFLTAVGLDPADPNITSITVIAPDTFTKDFPRKATASSNQYWFDDKFDLGLYYGGLNVLPGVTTKDGLPCGFVDYPSTLPAGLTEGGAIPGDPWLLLAYERDGAALDQATIDAASLRLNGEGPLRLIVPQRVPVRPDRGSQWVPSGCSDGWDYLGKAFDHNAGSAVRGVIAIRINPMPAGVEEFDYLNGGYQYLGNQQLIVYGYGIQ